MMKTASSYARAAGLAALCAFALIPATHAESGRPAVPVMISGESELDACGSLGRITGLDPKGDNFLAVRSGPGGDHKEIDRLSSGTEVTICDEQGSWLGVVYPAENSDADCATDAIGSTETPYAGPCRSGWVHARFVEIVAG